MQITPLILEKTIRAANDVIEQNAEEVAELDRAIGDGDHVINIQRGLKVLAEQATDISQLEWSVAWKKMGMLCMSKIGGASGSLFGTLFVAMAKDSNDKVFDTLAFSSALLAGVEAMKLRGKSAAGEKTMLDVLIPVAVVLQENAAEDALSDLLIKVKETAILGMESTENMLATKGRASFLEERSVGHIDAGARSSQLMICAIADVLLQECEAG
ncbi:MAG: dihydroxyacetone kinase subunit DhaL [Methyloprofundus sp.]|nr:dihydroxyacetone kinase subunit DhaL [Methyloprofundus sp.]